MGNYFLASLFIAIAQIFLIGIWFSLPPVLKPNIIQTFFILIPLYIPLLSALGIILSIVSVVKKEQGFPIIAGLLNLSIHTILCYAILIAIYSGI